MSVLAQRERKFIECKRKLAKARLGCNLANAQLARLQTQNEVLASLLSEVYAWTSHKDTVWAKATKAALDDRGGSNA